MDEKTVKLVCDRISEEIQKRRLAQRLLKRAIQLAVRPLLHGELDEVPSFAMARTAALSGCGAIYPLVLRYALERIDLKRFHLQLLTNLIRFPRQ